MKHAAQQFLERTFKPGDRIAFVIVNRGADAVTQRIASVQHAVKPDFQAWLRDQNSQKSEVYFSPNVLHLEARGRTKADIQQIRHVYLDFDDDGARRVAFLSGHSLLEPNFVVNSSPDRYQVFWTVENFEKAAAEKLMRHLARDTGADPAATDCSRVMRLPGLYNHKYGAPEYVRVEYRAEALYTPEHFPQPTAEDRSARNFESARGGDGTLSQSERDFAYALRALRRDEDPREVASTIAQYRYSEKSDPDAYAERTVLKAAESLAAVDANEPSR